MIIPVPEPSSAIFLLDLPLVLLLFRVAVILPESVSVFLKVVRLFVLLLFPGFLFPLL
jgi:hypothetical protein